MNSLTHLEQNIKNLKIQGASNIALAVIDGLKFAIVEIKQEKPANLHQSLLQKLTPAAFARPTEPLAQNVLRYIFQKQEDDVNVYWEKAQLYQKLIINAKQDMAKLGEGIIQDGGIYLTHCHSTTVTGLFIQAAKAGKKFKLFVTETRPLYQGRITAKELLSGGLTDVTMIIDDVATTLLLDSKINFSAVFIGADLLSSNGFVNKVGSLGISYVAQETHTPLYCLSILLKYDPRPFDDAILEKRSSQEIWPDAPKELKFYTPAFDFIPYYENIKIISETGLLSGPQVKNKALQLYPFLNSILSLT